MLKLKLDLDTLESTLHDGDFKAVCLQFPDGLKIRAKEIVDSLRKKFPETRFYIWAGSNYGGCDIPFYFKEFDLIVNFGHAEFK